jgi:hypothetical protein
MYDSDAAYNDAVQAVEKDSPIFSLHNLKVFLRLEIHLFYAIPIVGIIYVTFGGAVLRFLGLVVYAVYIVVHFTFAVIVTQIFLQPVVSRRIE